MLSIDYGFGGSGSHPPQFWADIRSDVVLCPKNPCRSSPQDGCVAKQKGATAGCALYPCYRVGRQVCCIYTARTWVKRPPKRNLSR